MTTPEVTDSTQTDPNEVKRLEKAYDLARELFNFSENVIKTIDEKSRNSVTTASAIAAFAFLVRKPETATLGIPNQLSLWCMAACVGLVYVLHVIIVRPQKSRTVDPAELRGIEKQSDLAEEVVYYNFAAVTKMYEANLVLSKLKSQLLNGQNIVLALTLASALWYLAAPAPTDPKASTEKPTTVSAPVSPVSAQPEMAPKPISPDGQGTSSAVTSPLRNQKP